MNPPGSVSRADSLRRSIVRLECPHELADGSWDGPIYVRLREARHIKPGDDCDFIVDDSSRRPGWMCQLIFYPQEFDTSPPRPEALNALAERDVLIPYTRLTRPHDDLSSELRERPLLMLYRFVRFYTCFVADADRQYVEVQLSAFVIGQVIFYRPTRGLSFHTASGAVLHPSSQFVCFVALRHQASESPVHVLLSCDAAWQAQVTRDEFMVGWCHGVPINCRPNQRSRRFHTRWKELAVPDTSDAELQKLLKDTFVPTGSDTTVDFGSEPIAVVSEFGRAITMTPLQYARQFMGPQRPSTRMDMDADSDDDSPSDVLATGLSRGHPLPHSFSVVRLSECHASGLVQSRPEPSDVSGASVSDPPAASGSVPASESGAVSQTPVPTTQPATDAVLTAILELTKTTQQMLVAQAASQQLLQEQLNRQPPPASMAPAAARVDPPEQRRSRSPAPSRRRRSRGRSPTPSRRRRSRSRSPVSGRQARGQRSRSRSRSRSRAHSSDQRHFHGGDGHRPPRHGRSPVNASRYVDTSPRATPFQRAPASGYDDSRAIDSMRDRAPATQSYWDSPRIDRGRSPIDRSPREWRRTPSPREPSERVPRHDDRFSYPAGRDQWMDGSARIERLIAPAESQTGGSAYRPSAAEINVHQTAQVGPRPNDRFIAVSQETTRLKRAAINESTLGTYDKKFRYWRNFCSEFGFPIWIDELSQERQARIVGLYAGLCALEGHNSRKKGNKYQTFDGKMAAVAFAHRCVRNARLNYKTPEFELIAQGYKRSHSQVERKQPVTTPMLLEMHQQLMMQRTEENPEITDILWGSVLLGFFFLDRSSELWGPIIKDSSTGGTTHCVKAEDVIIRDNTGTPIRAGLGRGASVEVAFRSHKGDRTRQGNVIRHYRSGIPELCPVAAAEACLLARQRIQSGGTHIGPYLTSTGRKGLISKSLVANTIKRAAEACGADPTEYSPHSLRIGGACALLAAGRSELVIKLMGRWSSWCFSVYTRLRPGMLRDVAEHMIRAATWECPELPSGLQGGSRNHVTPTNQVFAPPAVREDN